MPTTTTPAQENARKDALAASDELESDFDDAENEIQDKIDALEGEGHDFTQEELKRLAGWNAELDQLNDRRRAVIFIRLTRLPTSAAVEAMLKSVTAVRTQLQHDKEAVAGIVEKVNRIQKIVDSAGKVITTLTRLAALVT